MYTPSLNTRTRYCVVLDLVEIELLMNFYKKSLSRLEPRIEKMKMSNDGRGPLRNPEKLEDLEWLCNYHQNSLSALENYLKIMENTPLKVMDLI